MKKFSALVAAGLLACSADAIGITGGAPLPEAADGTLQTGMLHQSGAARRTLVSVKIGRDGQALLTTSLASGALLSVPFTVGSVSPSNDSLSDSVTPRTAPDLNQNLTRTSDTIPGFTSAATVPPDAALTARLAAWERQVIVELPQDAIGERVADSDLPPAIMTEPTTNPDPTVTNALTAEEIQAMPDGPLPWWVTPGVFSVLFSWSAHAKKRKLAFT